MTPLPQCSDLARRGYTPNAINVIHANGKCTDASGIPLQPSSAQTAFPIETGSSDPLVILGFMLGATLAFGSTIMELLGGLNLMVRRRKP